jgi:hypothetical protein
MLSKYVALRVWVESGRGGAAFCQYHQIAWFVRNHFAELVASGTFIPGTGSRPTLVAPRFDKIVERILMREARAALTQT